MVQTGQDRWVPVDLTDRVAVVTGATRGVGRGIAEVLGSCGVTVYVTGRSTRTRPTRGNPEWSLDSVVETIRALGGTAIPVRCDHLSDEDTERLFDQVRSEQNRIDILVNNTVGWSDHPGDATEADADTFGFVGHPPWEEPLWWWDANVAGGLRAHVATCRYGIPLMLDRRGGLVAFTSERPGKDPADAEDVALDLRANATARLVAVLAGKLRPHGIASVLLYPGWTRSEEIVADFEARRYPLVQARDELYEKTVSPHYAGRAVASLAADTRVLNRSGTMVVVGELARELGFTDVDGRQPNPV